jgi:NhaP-type Na+/H+ or K+/H+ antiporter
MIDRSTLHTFITVSHVLARHDTIQQVPYTVVLLCVGLAIGTFNRYQNEANFDSYLRIASIDPHMLLYIFLPVLIFESCYNADAHVFKKSFWSILVLALPGLSFCTSLNAVVLHSVFPYGWSWAFSSLCGAILSATDPVAVVSLLHHLGASKQLATLIEGESLLNDGTAIVIFIVLKDVVISDLETGDTDLDWGATFIKFLYVALGGPVVGYMFGIALVFCINVVYNDAVVEITSTLVAAYLCFYTAEQYLKVSGVLAVVILGLYVNTYGRATMGHQVGPIRSLLSTIMPCFAMPCFALPMLPNTYSTLYSFLPSKGRGSIMIASVNVT